ncbi:hypothetical protein [Halovivax limisalsi]|nr:hypothetical protein [Halovivax limisalsi]
MSSEPSPATSDDRYECLLRDDGHLELRHRERADEWIATDAPAEIRP